MPLFKERLAEGHTVRFGPKGTSMMPMIRQNIDTVVIAPVTGKLKKYDVPLYQRKGGQYVLHRVIAVKPDSYVLCGDNRWSREYGITDRHIIGMLTAVIRDGREISVSDWRCRLYAHLWCDLFPVRALVLRTKHFIKKAMKVFRRRTTI